MNPDSAGLSLYPWVPEGAGLPFDNAAVLWAFPIAGRVALGVASVNHVHAVSGLASAAEVRAFARELLRLSAELLGPAETARLDGHEPHPREGDE